VKLAAKIITGAATALAVAGLTLLLIWAVFTLFDGLLRALANTPLDFVREIGDLVAAICGACCLPIALLHRSNITLRVFEKVLPSSAARAVDALADILIALVMIGMAWQFFLFAEKAARAHDVTWLLNVPNAPFWFVVDAILWVAVAVQVFVFLEGVCGMRVARSEESAL
jgi:TRAP-type C4-dicarboxylate transport system permease small subunit